MAMPAITHAIEQLWIGHWPEPAACAAALLPRGRAFMIETCLRRLAVTTDAATARALGALRPPETRAGTAAYQLLLEVATGLKSTVPGETNVFGQIRRAWEAHRQEAGPDSLAALGPLITQLVADTRAIRREHLQNIGGASYGGLVRRLLRPRDGEHVLLVGAGDLARSMLPFFRACRLGVWNRRPPGPAFAAADRQFAAEDGALAADWAHHVILTTPADTANDRCWMRWIGGSLAVSAVHLGHRRSGQVEWPAHVRGYDLDDVFDLRRAQDNIRSLQLERARQDCRRRALRLAGECDGTATRRVATG